MTDFQWRTIAPSTLKAYTVAAKDFETVTGLNVDRADAESVSRWQASMEARGLSVNTIRQRLSAVCVISGVAFTLPKREKAKGETLSAEEVRQIMNVVSDKEERLLLVRLLMIGSMARRVRMAADDTFRAHFMGAQDVTLSSKLVSRKLQRYAKQAGIAGEINMRIWCQSGRKLMSEQGVQELVSLLTFSLPSEDTRLHGMNRRSHTVSA